MRKNLKSTDIEFQMFSDYYTIYKDFYEPEESDEYWKALIQATDDFCKKYPSKFAQDIVMAYLESREVMYKSLKKPLL